MSELAIKYKTLNPTEQKDVNAVMYKEFNMSYQQLRNRILNHVGFNLTQRKRFEQLVNERLEN